MGSQSDEFKSEACPFTHEALLLYTNFMFGLDVELMRQSPGSDRVYSQIVEAEMLAGYFNTMCQGIYCVDPAPPPGTGLSGELPWQELPSCRIVLFRHLLNSVKILLSQLFPTPNPLLHHKWYQIIYDCNVT